MGDFYFMIIIIMILTNAYECMHCVRDILNVWKIMKGWLSGRRIGIFQFFCVFNADFHLDVLLIHHRNCSYIHDKTQMQCCG